MLSIYVVEDALSIRDRFIAMLKEIPQIEVVGASISAEEACRAITELRPQLVTLDLGLKHSSGLTVLPLIKALDPPPFVIVLTNYAEGAYRDRCAFFGADRFFDKSLEFLDAVNLIEEMSRQHSKGTSAEMPVFPGGPAA